MARIETLEQLRALYKAPAERTLQKVIHRMDTHCRTLIAHAPFLLLATSSADGPADVSPRGGEPGFVRVADDKTLEIPDFPGNNRLDTLTNIVSNPEVAAIFLVPGMDETLRINGTAEIRDDTELCADFAVNGRPPKAVIRVTVRDAYLHCAKALMRSRLWDPAARIDRASLPTMGQMLKDQIGHDDPPESREEMLERYKDALY